MNLVDMVRAVDTVRYAFDCLPATASGIADEMVNHGLRGCIGDPENCPLALHVDKVLSDYGITSYVVSVHSDNIVLDSIGADCGFHFPTPEVVAEFVALFDCGSYPDLIHDPECVSV